LSGIDALQLLFATATLPGEEELNEAEGVTPPIVGPPRFFTVKVTELIPDIPVPGKVTDAGVIDRIGGGSATFAVTVAAMVLSLDVSTTVKVADAMPGGCIEGSNCTVIVHDLWPASICPVHPSLAVEKPLLGRPLSCSAAVARSPEFETVNFGVHKNVPFDCGWVHDALV
jgi:hypothetical protein